MPKDPFSLESDDFKALRGRLGGFQESIFGAGAGRLRQKAVGQRGTALRDLIGRGITRSGISEFPLQQIRNEESRGLADLFGRGAQSMFGFETEQANLSTQNRLQDILNQRQLERMLPYLQALQKQQRSQSKRSGLGGLTGMGIGALLALPTGGMSLAAGAALGGQFGSSLGQFGFGR